ncbi:methyltransferase domain-containing protein [Aestuariivivens sediminis]|uniref:methyltransferase domain-containing protein n=1 Tax=Aestuariivivens sediminis TaxID=2913557 RepID=UPI001F589436|nr:methyltransferase domain-containing protein [Aestuariivivens sediminis]
MESSEAIEKIILSRDGDWEFDHQVSLVFDDHVRKSIPCYNDIQELIGILSKKILSQNSLVYDLGTATGEIIRSIHRANPNTKIRYVGVDKSVSMLKVAREKCRTMKQVTFYNQDLETFTFKPAKLIVAAFTFQFIKTEHRPFILESIYKALKPNGHFILCEKISYADAAEHDFFVNVHHTWKENHFTFEEIRAKKERLKHIMQPLTLEENMALLGQANFEHPQLFFKWCNFACILAKKAMVDHL